MKKIVILFFVLLSFFANAGTYYMATNGNNSNSGAIGSPWLTIEYSVSQMVAGDTLYIRGGTYYSTKSSSAVNRFQISSKTGNSGAWFYIFNYPGEQPIFNCGDVYVPGTAGDGPVGLKVNDCSYIHIRGIKIERLDQNPAGINTPAGCILYNTPNFILEGIWVDDIEGYGFYFQGGSSNGTILNCDASRLIDLYTGLGGANGYNITGGDASTNLLFKKCRAWYCSDDGFDNYGVAGTFTYDSCWAFWNGYYPNTWTTAGDGMGFKLGPCPEGNENNTLRYVYNCLATGNRLNGFDQNSQSTTTCRMVFYNNSAISNGSNGYFFGANLSTIQTFKNNLNYNNGIWGDEIINASSTVSYNTWNLSVTVNSGDFQSLDTSQLDGARNPNTFALPVITYANLVSGSDLRGAGTTTTGGAGTDLGAFQYVAPQTPVENGFRLRGRRYLFRNQ